MFTKSMGSMMAGAFLLVAASAVPAAAQTRMKATFAKRDNAAAEAAALQKKAQALYESGTHKYARAAALELKAADMLSEGNPQRVASLELAARLYYYHGDVYRAQPIMERAGDEALAAGDVVTAAHAYVDAAFIAVKQGDVTKVNALADKAELLTRSPLLTAAQRSGIVTRLAGRTVAATN